MKKLKNITNKILLILITISLVVFSGIPNNINVYGATSISQLQSDIVEYAKQWIGVTPYVWGGTSLTNGADCSGFVMQIYKEFGISLPHGTASLLNVGTSVSWSEIQLGDVIITRSSGSESGRHTGIYAGNGQWVNAAGKNIGTIISNVNTSKIETIRRIVNDDTNTEKRPSTYPDPHNNGNILDGGYVAGGYTLSGFKPMGDIDNTDDNPLDLDSLEFDFAGNPEKMEYNGVSKNAEWLFSKFSQFVDYILGIMVQGLKGAIVGWTAIIEGWINDILNALN